jgi:hypothetical protein
MLGLLFGALPSLANAALGYFTKRTDAELDGFKAAVGADSVDRRAAIQAHLENNRLKAAANGWWGAKAIILCAGLPAALHMAAIFLDSLPFPGHVVGAWGIPKPPPPYDGYERDIVMSFFLVMPAMPIVNSVAAWLTRRR